MKLSSHSPKVTEFQGVPELPLPAGRGVGKVGFFDPSPLPRTLAGLIAVNLGCLAMNLFRIGSFWFVWVSPAVLVLYCPST